MKLPFLTISPSALGNLSSTPSPSSPSALSPTGCAPGKRSRAATLSSFVGDLCEYDFVRDVLRDFQPEAIVHFGEQPSAPFSMIDQRRCVMTQVNNITGTLNILWAMREHAPAAHLVKLGTMGEYGTPNIDIEEGFIEIEYKGRKDVLPYPEAARLVLPSQQGA